MSCDVKLCGSSEIQMASVNPQMGKAVDDWETLPKENLDLISCSLNVGTFIKP